MAKSSIRKTDPADSLAPAKGRRTAASDTSEATPASKAAPRSRRKTGTPVAVAATPAPQVAQDATSGHAERFDVTHDQIAVRAYHLYLERGGHTGDQFHDWVTAERELREQFARARS